MAVYTLVNEYRRLIHMANFGNKDFSKMCRITNGEVDEKGNIYVTKEILEKFTVRVKEKCISEALYWCKYIPALDVFVKNMLNFEDPILLLKEKNNKQLIHIYECWFGDIYKEKHEEGFLNLQADIDKKRKDMNIELFKELNTIENEEDTLLNQLPL